MQEAIALVLEANGMLAQKALGGQEVVLEIKQFLARKLCRDLEVPEP